ncbi:MAG: aminomethyl-transferring glycine dehydrogenase subunit GcvPB [Kiritimatiellae bacterium]|nr:aminomethyl-transferring glycine dehydrogenase subunit GcvPB [Kiritimatiellia bacterium]
MTPLIFDKSVPGRRAVTIPRLSPAELEAPLNLPEGLLAEVLPGLPEVSELDVIRHFTALSQQNFSVDTNFYPLGSCTMKYNPRVCEKIAALDGFAGLHPLLPQLCCGGTLTQGALEALWQTERLLCELTGMSAFTLQPMAGAHGELTGMLLIAAYHRANGEKREKVLIPDSAHGTNPASASIAGFKVVSVATDADGNVDIADFKSKLDRDTAAVMLTCPNTLGIFERSIREIAGLAHDNGTLLYYDGANMNALMGRARPGDLGFDVVHLNVHKTLSTPHGGGGPGAGPVGVTSALAPFLPISTVEKHDDGTYALNYDRPQSIGYIAPFYGNFAVLARALAYMLLLGGDGLRQATDHAVLNANYLRVKLQDDYDIPYNRVCMHEVLLSADRQMKRSGVRALDIAKALIDAGHHPPTVYFPMIVHEALMIEPTETESKETLDAFAADMIRIARLAQSDPEAFKSMPENTAFSRLDETLAARAMKLTASQES